MVEFFRITYDKNGVFLTNKKTSKIRKSTFEKETSNNDYEMQNYNTWVKETKRKRIEIKKVF